MGYAGLYSLGSRCLSEFLATCTVIFLGESVLANELLAKTKGHGERPRSSHAPILLCEPYQQQQHGGRAQGWASAG